MAIIPFATGTNRGVSFAIDTEEVENLYAEVSETGKSVVSLIMRPGLASFANYGNLEIRGLHVTGDSTTRYTVWTIHGASLIRQRDGEAPVGVGLLATASGPCYLESNGTQVMVTDGANGYIYDENTTTFTQLDSGTHGWTLTAPRWITYLSTYFIVLDAANGGYYISDNNNGLQWNATDVGFAETDPDGTVMLIADQGELWLFGTRSTEVHFNTGAADFPFQPKLSATAEWGTAAPFAVSRFDSSLAFLGQSEQGGLRVFRFNGYQPDRISNSALENAIKDYTTVNDAVAFSFDYEQHAFYMLTFPTEDVSWLYDQATDQWFKVSTSGGGMARYLGQWATGRENQMIVSDYRGGSLYTIEDNGSDAEFPIYTKAVGKTINDDEQWIDHANFQVVCEQGTSDGVGILRWSDDNGQTWSNFYARVLGPIGRYDRRMRWNRLGRARNRTYDFRLTDPGPKVITGMVVNGGP